MSLAIMWFRQDLRCLDNPALSAACEAHESIIPLYILQNLNESIGGAQVWWLHHSLSCLQKELGIHSLNLNLKRGNPYQILKELTEEYPVTGVYWNRCYEPASIERDQHIKKELRALGITVNSFNGSLFNEPWTIKNKSGNPFRVFTPYWKHSLNQIKIPEPFIIKNWPKNFPIHSENLMDWYLLPKKPNWAKNFDQFWQPGEQGAIKKLEQFVQQPIQNYQQYRDFPTKAATSRLSPHLHFGEISPWQIARAIEQVQVQPDSNLASTQCFLTELGWREFSYYQLFHFPDLPFKNLKQEFDLFSWQTDNENLRLWQQGLTGFPIVDAGMRELWHTGYMHNRVRMIVASFLVKDLFIDWREGAKWFWYTLLDADLANNSASWQWIAGSGFDASPYFRIFNPVIQGEKFDPKGEYIKTWIPELKKLSEKWIHKPWEAPLNVLPVKLGIDYPRPLVNHNEARRKALQYYDSIKKSKLLNT